MYSAPHGNGGIGEHPLLVEQLQDSDTLPPARGHGAPTPHLHGERPLIRGTQAEPRKSPTFG